MTEQNILNFPEPGLARKTDPLTSHQAAESVDASPLMERIYYVMVRYGARGCISDDIAYHLPDVGVQTFSPRFRQMINRGMIECTGETRKGSSGRQQLVRRVLPPPWTPARRPVTPADRVRRAKDTIRAWMDDLKPYSYETQKALREMADDVLYFLEQK